MTIKQRKFTAGFKLEAACLELDQGYFLGKATSKKYRFSEGSLSR